MITTATNQPKPTTLWQYAIYAIRNEQGETVNRCLTSSTGQSLEDAIRGMMADVVHYIGCGYQVEVRDVVEVCVKCNGEGAVAKRRGKFYLSETVKCKACKGVGGFAKLDTIDQPEFSYGLKINL